jgi:hypothetical protein
MTDRLTHRSCSALFTPLHFALVKHVKRQIIRLRLAHILRRGGGAGSGHKDATLLSKPGAVPHLRQPGPDHNACTVGCSGRWAGRRRAGPRAGSGTRENRVYSGGNGRTAPMAAPRCHGAVRGLSVL